MDLLFVLGLVFVVHCQDLGLNLLSLPKSVHEFVHVHHVDEAAESKGPLIVFVVHIGPSDGILDHLHAGNTVDANGELLAEAKHIGIEAEVRLADVEPAEEDDGGREARAAVVLVDGLRL